MNISPRAHRHEGQAPYDNALHSLKDGHTMRLSTKRDPFELRMIEGQAWISYDAKDVIAEAGDIITLPRQNLPVIISPLNKHRSIRFQLSCA